MYIVVDTIGPFTHHFFPVHIFLPSSTTEAGQKMKTLCSQLRLILLQQGDITWHSSGQWNTCRNLFKNILNYTLFPFLCIHPEDRKTETQTDTCTLMFIAAFFTRAERRKQSKYPSTDQRIFLNVVGMQWNIIQL